MALLLAIPAVGLAAAAPPSIPWPSVAEQLQRDHVRPGSALERLIRGNQDFGLLRADEATDNRGIPPWLRVYWRKAHPELTYRADDPSGGYPLVLKDIYEWMIYHQDLVAGSSQAAAVEVEKSLTVGANQRISGLQIAPRSESDIRINPWSSSQVIAAANDIESSGRQAQFYSGDGGTTWGQTSLPLLSSDTFQGDPAVDWTSDGTAWATSLGINISGFFATVAVRAYRSSNGGATWTYDGTISGSQTTPDKEMLWADHSATSPFKDNLYAVWVYQGNTYVNRRTGPSGAWGTPLSLLVSTFSAEAGADVKSNAYGDVFVFWPGTDNGAAGTPNRIFVQKSTDGGQTFQAGVTAARTYGLYQYGIPAQSRRLVLIYVSGGAYRTASKNLVYAAWNDLTGAAGCTSNANAPGTNAASACKSRIWLARSTDGGATWSTPVMINNQASLNDQFFPHLTVDQTNGTVSIAYYDTVNDPGRLKTDVWYQSSYDDGATWSSPTKVTTAQTDESPTATGADLGNQYGDYIGMSAYAGALLPSWTDRRNSAKEEIWTAQVQDIPPPPVPPTACFSFTCSALSCNFDASCSTDDRGIVSYAWAFGDSGTGSGVTASHTYAATGGYSVTLTVTDTNGLTSSVSRKVQVNSDPLPAAESFFTVPRCRILDTRSGSPLSSGVPRTINVAGNCNVPSSAKAISFVVTAYQPTGGGWIAFYPGNLPITSPNKASINFAPATSPRSNNAVVRLATDGSGTLEINATVNATPGQVHVTLDVDGYFSEDTTAASGAQGPFGFQPVPPCRVVDTRPSSPLVAGAARTFSIQGACGIPSSGVAAVSANTRVVNSPQYGGSIVLYPANVPTPTATNVSFTGGIFWIYGGSLTALAPSTPDLGMRFDSTTSGATAFTLFDVNGYFSSGSPLKYHPLAGCRIVDTRAADSGAPSVTASSTRTFQAQGNCNIPVGAKAVFADVIAVGPTGTGDIRLYPANTSAPVVATVCFDAGESAIGNGVILSLGPTIPDLALWANPATGTLDVVIEVFGYFQ
ncbi:MAG TPA: PKD domain-containing protein [Thermoanaerobaculia bacterium]